MKDIVTQVGVFGLGVFGTALLITTVVLSDDIVSPTPAAPGVDTSIAHWNAFWEPIVSSQSSQAAYDRFVTSYIDGAVSDQHELAHRFGAVLFAEHGADAITACDARFSYGCFHEVIGQILLDTGAASLPVLSQQCGDDLGCQHGIGHGLVAFHGYSTTSLKRALLKCDVVTQPDAIDGCLGGVFMEYNMRTMLLSEVNHAIRAFDPRALPQPCNKEMTSSQRESCFFWLAQWLLEAVPSDQLIERFTYVGDLCRAYGGAAMTACFGGIGYNANHYARPVATVDTSQLCTIAAQSNSTHYAACMTTAAGDMAATGDVSTAEAFCAQIVPDRRSACLTTVKSSQSIHSSE